MSACREDVVGIVPTRGDVDMTRVLESLVWDVVVVWDNSSAREDLGAFGRYAAIALTTSEIVYVQDDDCLVSEKAQLALLDHYRDGELVSNMHDTHNAGMPHLALPGWGAMFRRDLPALAFDRWREAEPADAFSRDFLTIGCDIVFPVMTPSRMVDLGHENLPHAHGADRTCQRPDYQSKKKWYYRRAAELR